MSAGPADAQLLWNQRLSAAEANAKLALANERDGNLSEAYALCVQTVQLHIWLIRNTVDSLAKETLKAASARILARAEKIKAVKGNVQAAPASCLDERKVYSTTGWKV